MDVPAYEAFLTTEIDKGNAIEKVLYLRESDKEKIRCKINYKIDGEAKAVYLDIPAVATEYAPDFQRNRFLNASSLVRLRLLIPPTCVGFRYGLLSLT